MTEVISLADLQAQSEQSGRPYLEFLRVPAMSAGLYVLPAGGTDGQQPHTEDEIYYVIAGRAQFQIDQESRAVQAGSILYVPADVPHRFHSIEEELSVLVVFAPAEYTRAPGAQVEGQPS